MSASVMRSRRSQCTIEAAEAIQHAAQVVKRPRDVEVGHVDMPMLMRLGRLLEAGPFLGRLRIPLAQQSRPAQHPPHTGRTHRHDVGVQHHEGQPPVALQRVLQMEIDDCLLFPILQPKVPGNPTVVLVDAAIALSPIVELARRSRPTTQRIARRRSRWPPTSA